MEAGHIVGHEGVEKSLLQLLGSGNLPHAFLFHGCKGIGKRLTAEFFGRSLLCGIGDVESDKLTYDTSHKLYPQIEAGSSSDFLILEPEEGKKSISINQVRTTLSKLSLSSDGQRVVIVDAAEQLTNQAANALLKTLEEPGQGVHLILISHNLSKLLPTIISRCRQFRFSPLTSDQLIDVFMHILKNEDESSMHTLLRMCGGSPGEALRYVGQGLEIYQELEGFFGQLPIVSTSPVTQLAANWQKNKSTDMAAELLLKKISRLAKGQDPSDYTSLLWTDLYLKIENRFQNMEEFNLTPQLTLETTLMDVVSSTHI